ncbi:MAG TPA: CHAP domain-containing protein [Nocardioidaceae bacterium]|nr:CHAP domain-containing protein [Nocardioidaceae bacterium]
MTDVTAIKRAAGMATATLALGLVPLVGPASVSVAADQTASTQLAAAGDGTADGAIQWMQEHDGDSSYEGYCEMAVENAWGTTGQWPSAIDHWYGAVNAGKAHEGDYNPPAGAFVYWNTSQYGHVGIADGAGGFYSSSYGGAIGHGDSLDYFVNYLGWSDPQVPQG